MELLHINRFQAFFWHLCASIAVAVMSALLVFVVLYPEELTYASGVTDIFWIVLAVDVTLGPIVTFIIFNPKKKELKLDLAIVVIVQIGALLYGLHVVYVARPVYMVFNVDRFDLVFANEFSQEKLSKVVKPDFKSLPWFGVEVIAARLPENVRERNEVTINAMLGGDDVYQIPQYYVLYEEEKENVVKRSQDLDALKKYNKDNIDMVEQSIAKFNEKHGSVGFLPLKGRVKDLAVIIDRGSGDVVDMLDLAPWS